MARRKEQFRDPTETSDSSIPENNDTGGIDETIEEPISDTPAPRAPNPEFVKMDPMAELFGPGSNLKMIGDVEADEMPDEIRGLIEENGLSKRDFSCVLKEVPAGSNSENADSSMYSVYIKAWKRAIPSLDYIAREHGPGNYVLVLSWQVHDRESGTRKMRREIVPVMISDKCASEHKKHLLDKKINEAAATGEKVRGVLIEKTIEGQLVDAITGKKEETKQQTPKEYIAEIMETVRMMGLPVGGATAPVRIEWDKILPAVVPLVTAFLTMQQNTEQRRIDESNKMFMLLLSQNQNASSQLMEMLKIQAMKPQGENPLKDMQAMIMNALDIKQLLNPPQETLADKIFRVVESVVPQVLTIAANASQKHEQPKGPMVEMAKAYVRSDPDFSKLKSDPAEMMKFVQKLDDRIGWENADIILNVVEWDRPPQCVRDPMKRYAPKDVGIEDGQIDDNPTVQD